MAGYQSEQIRFAGWCAATGRQALPAGPLDVLAYLEAEQPTGGTAARWVAGIRSAHLAAGLADPCAGPPAAWVRRARNPATRHALPAGVVAGLASRIPVAGWPAGLFGRRNRLALVLHHLGALPARRLVTLRATDIAVVAPATVTVTTADRQVPVTSPYSAHAACPACAALRWGWVLRQAADFNRPAIVRRLRRPSPAPDIHVCDAVTSVGELPGPAAWPLFPAADRWGHFPAPRVPAMSLRAMEGILRDATDGRGVYRRLPERAPVPPPRTDPPPPPPPVAVNRTWFQDGVAARARERRALREVADKLDQLDRAAERLEAASRQLLDQATSTEGSP